MSLENFSIIESTLREGEQFVNAFFTTEQKVRIATLLDAFGVEYLELTTPVASPQSEKDCRTIAKLGLHTKILTHTRCALEDVQDGSRYRRAGGGCRDRHVLLPARVQPRQKHRTDHRPGAGSA